MSKGKYYLQTALFALLFLCLGACSSAGNDEEQPNLAIGGKYTYRMILKGNLDDYLSTRAVATWADGAIVYIQFYSGTDRLMGEAVYSETSEEWTVTVNGKLTEAGGTKCEAYYFAQQAKPVGTIISLSAQEACYCDVSASYLLDDDLVLVQASLAPIMGRVRFIGNANTNYNVSGLTTYTAYDLQNNIFTTTNSKLSVAVGSEGSSGYYYATFTDAAKRQLTVDGAGATAYSRTFGTNVLAKGKSGYITLPTSSNWTLINTDNMEEITLPTLSDVTTSQIRSYAVSIDAKLTSNGNGRITSTGFVYATNSQPTLEAGTAVTCNNSVTLNARITTLQSQTTYYVRAFAINERGIAYSTETSFTTLSKEEDGTDFSREDYGEDEDLGGQPTTVHIEFGYEGYGEDDGANNTQDSNGNSGFGRTDFDDDENMGNSASSTNGFGKDSYENDENWN